MNYIYKFLPVALVEYAEAVEWYKEKRIATAENFIADVTERIKDICADPSRYRNTYKYFREVSLKKYPYYIVYFIDTATSTIVISAVYHHKRNPKNKFKNRTY